MSEEWPGHNTKPKEIFVISDFCYESMETLRGDRTIKLHMLYKGQTTLKTNISHNDLQINHLTFLW